MGLNIQRATMFGKRSSSISYPPMLVKEQNLEPDISQMRKKYQETIGISWPIKRTKGAQLQNFDIQRLFKE